MLFNSIEFLIYFPIVTLIYFLLPHKSRWIHLLAASFFFYMAFLPIYVLILLLTIIVDYFAGIYIEKSEGGLRKFYLIISLIGNIGFLCLFKYYDFIIGNLNTAFYLSLPKLNDLWISEYIIYYNNFVNTFINGHLGTHLAIIPDIILPIGLSFHTFQAMSYTIEVYRGNQKAERHFGIYSLYVMFYPQLVAGPIERPQNVLHQFYEKHSFDYDRAKEGLKMILWGLLKKIVIADRLALYVNSVYGNPEAHSGTTLLTATFLFAFQIYCDFSAYSEIAIGAAKVMGFELMTNFRRPYFAKTVSEFWRRWHISLSSWFTDYLYIPLGGNRVAVPRAYLNIMIVFLMSGLWHGASWTFVIWGAINGFYLIFAKIAFQPKQRLKHALGINEKSGVYQAFQMTSTFILACFAWIFFRAESLSDSGLILSKILTFSGTVWFDNTSMAVYTIAAVFSLLLIEALKEYKLSVLNFYNHSSWIVRDMAFVMTIVIILMFGVFDGGQFIYFQF